MPRSKITVTKHLKAPTQFGQLETGQGFLLDNKIGIKTNLIKLRYDDFNSIMFIESGPRKSWYISHDSLKDETEVYGPVDLHIEVREPTK